jgi:hypothetical protein
MAREKRRSPGRPRAGDEAEKTPLQLARWAAMAGRGVTQQAIVDELGSRGVFVSRDSVWATLMDKYDNADVATAFCELTATSREEMFPGTASERRERAETKAAAG